MFAQKCNNFLVEFPIRERFQLKLIITSSSSCANDNTIVDRLFHSLSVLPENVKCFILSENLTKFN